MSKAQTLDLLMQVLQEQGARNRRSLRVAITRAERRAGLSRTEALDDRQIDHLLWALASEGGAIQRAAERVASWRSSPPAEPDETGQLARSTGDVPPV